MVKQRTAELVILSPAGDLLGCLPAVPVATPWWQDVEPVVSAARVHHGIDVVVLRLIDTELEQPHGGRVTYLAEAAEPVAVGLWSGVLDDHPCRHAYARPGGPAADLEWARARLADRGLRLRGSPVQVRTWNLSSLWRLPVEGRTVWLKVVPQFFAHEGALLARMAGAPIPKVIARESGRMLLAEIAGEDMYGAAMPQLLRMTSLLVGLQRQWADRVEELIALGLPDWRAPALMSAIADVVDRTRNELSEADRSALSEFVRTLPSRFTEVAACGLPDALVHGDFHPGNFRGEGDRLTLLDWADSGVGHPLLDQAAFDAAVAYEDAEAVRAHWLQLWSNAVPGSDPVRALGLIAPIAAARRAVTYRKLLDNIEPAEQRYHRADPANWLKKTASFLQDECEAVAGQVRGPSHAS